MGWIDEEAKGSTIEEPFPRWVVQDSNR